MIIGVLSTKHCNLSYSHATSFNRCNSTSTWTPYHNNIIINVNINKHKVSSKTGPHHSTTESTVTDKAKQWLELGLIKTIGFCQRHLWQCFLPGSSSCKRLPQYFALLCHQFVVPLDALVLRIDLNPRLRSSFLTRTDYRGRGGHWAVL